MFRLLMIAAILAAPGALLAGEERATAPAPPPSTNAAQPQAKWPECYCTDSQGARVELGETRCLSVDGRSFLAQCEMALNNPMWREVGRGCPSS